MDSFFSTRDWFGRTDESFLFNTEHIAFIVIAFIVGIALPLILRKARVSQKTIHRVLVGLWLSCVIWDLVKWLWGMIPVFKGIESFNVASGMPFHTCSVYMFVAPFALFARGKVRTAASSFLTELSLITGFVSLILSFAMMNCYSVFSFYGMHTMVYHSILYIMPMTMLITGYYKPQKKDFLYGFAAFMVVFAVIFTFDNIYKTDYMYIYDGSTFEIFKVISQNVPHRLVWTVLAVIAYFLIIVISHLVIRIIQRGCSKSGEEQAPELVEQEKELVTK
ncbi:MAG: YwaF family protein [Clostridia bacterium]|nr:YwaF family protein [Clostridia bacterium]